MSDETIVHLLRHGEVENPAGIIYGRLPGYHLSANGRAMASAAADYFAGRPVAALFCSPLERAQETARRALDGEEVARRRGGGVREQQLAAARADLDLDRAVVAEHLGPRHPGLAHAHCALRAA